MREKMLGKGKGICTKMQGKWSKKERKKKTQSQMVYNRNMSEKIRNILKIGEAKLWA